MSSLLARGKGITPWIEDAIFHAVTFDYANTLPLAKEKEKVVNGNYITTIGEKKIQVSRKPKIVQVLKYYNNNKNQGKATGEVDGKTKGRTKKGDRSLPYLLVHDGEISVKAYLELEENAVGPHVERGTIVRITGWTVSTVYSCCPKDSLSSPSSPLCLCISDNVEMIGGGGMGIVGEPTDVHDSIDVRRALESGKRRPTNFVLCSRLRSADEFLQRVFLSSSMPIGDVTKLFSSNRPAVAVAAIPKTPAAATTTKASTKTPSVSFLNEDVAKLPGSSTATNNTDPKRTRSKKSPVSRRAQKIPPMTQLSNSTQDDDGDHEEEKSTGSKSHLEEEQRNGAQNQWIDREITIQQDNDGKCPAQTHTTAPDRDNVAPFVAKSVTAVNQMQQLFSKVLQQDAEMRKKKQNKGEQQQSAAKTPRRVLFDDRDSSGTLPEIFSDSSSEEENNDDDTDLPAPPPPATSSTMAPPCKKTVQANKQSTESRQLQQMIKQFDARLIIEDADSEYNQSRDLQKVCNFYKESISHGVALVKQIEKGNYDEDNGGGDSTKKKGGTRQKGKDLDSMRDAIAALYIANTNLCQKAKNDEMTLKTFENATECSIAKSVGSVWWNYATFCWKTKRWTRTNGIFLQALVGNKKNRESGEVVQTGSVPLEDDYHGKLWDDFLNFSRIFKHKFDLTMEELREQYNVVMPDETEPTESTVDKKNDESRNQGMEASADDGLETGKNMKSSSTNSTPSTRSNHNPNVLSGKTIETSPEGMGSEENPKNDRSRTAPTPDDVLGEDSSPRKETEKRCCVDDRSDSESDFESDSESNSESESESDQAKVFGISEMLISQDSWGNAVSQTANKTGNSQENKNGQTLTSVASAPDRGKDVDDAAGGNLRAKPSKEQNQSPHMASRNLSVSGNRSAYRDGDTQKSQQPNNDLQENRESQQYTPPSEVSDDAMDDTEMSCSKAQKNAGAVEDGETDSVLGGESALQLAGESAAAEQNPPNLSRSSVAFPREKKRRRSSTASIPSNTEHSDEAKRRKRRRKNCGRQRVVFDIGAWLSKNAKNPRSRS